MKTILQAAVLATAIGTALPALAHGDQHQSGQNQAKAEISTEQHAFGRQGEPRRATRTVKVDMRDTMRFSPSTLSIKQGETVRFIVTNGGKAMHEMVLGTMAQLKQHGELMKQYPGMEHDEPYMVHVAPGKQQEMVWQFTEPGEFHFGCLIPGHFEAGMIGKITVTKG